MGGGRSWVKGMALPLLLMWPVGPTTASDDPQAVETLLAEADRLRTERTADSLAVAVQLYRQAIELCREAGDMDGASEIGLSLGKAYEYQGEIQHAIVAYEDALASARLGGRTEVEIRALLGIGTALGAAGEGRRAIESLRQARELLSRHADPKLRVSVLFHIAVAFERLGEYQEALERYHEVLPLLRAAGLQQGVVSALNNLGTVTFELGDLEQSLRFYRQVVTKCRQMGDTAGEAKAWTRVGEVEQARGESRQAGKHFLRALALARRAGDRRTEADTLNLLSSAHLDLAETESARGLLDQALRLSRALPAPRIEAFALELLGRLHSMLGELETALDYYAQAVVARRATGHLRGEMEALAASAALHKRLGELDPALSETKAALEILESLRGRTTRQDLRTSLFAAQRNLHELHIELLMAKHQRRPDAGHDAEALAVVERSRARSLLDQLTESTDDLRRGVDPELLQLERELGERLDKRAAELLWLHELSIEVGLEVDTAKKEQVLTAQIEALVADLRRARGRIRHQSPGYAALAAPEPLDATAIREQLDAETLFLVYMLGQEHSFLWAVSRERLTSHWLPSGAVIEGAALRLYQLLTARNRRQGGETASERRRRIAKADGEFVGAAQELADLVLAPLDGELSRQRLVVVGDGLLNVLPFAALPSGEGEPLIIRHEVVYLPSVSVLAPLRRPARRPSATRSLWVLADPVFQLDARVVDRAAGDEKRHALRGFRPLDRANPPRLDRLRFSRREAKAISDLLPPGEVKVLLDFEAGRAGLLGSGIERYRMLHFATHALVDDERPELTGLALSRFDEQGRIQPGFLRLHEIQRLQLAADLVTLSACETALGKPVDGEGLVGLVHGFMHSGTDRVVASLWSVQDLATSELMERFYRAMLMDGRRPAAALRQAQITLRGDRRFTAPYFWAPFVLQGEWR